MTDGAPAANNGAAAEAAQPTADGTNGEAPPTQETLAIKFERVSTKFFGFAALVTRMNWKQHGRPCVR